MKEQSNQNTADSRPANAADGFDRLHLCLQRLTGLHRQLLETVRAEHDAIAQAQLKEIQDATYAKQALIEGIRQTEADRLRALGEIALLWKKPAAELTLSAVIIGLQGFDPKRADLFRSSLNALTVLIKRVTEQNEENRFLVDRTLAHIGQMKKNLLGEASPRAQTYTPQGRQSNATAGARLISKEI